MLALEEKVRTVVLLLPDITLEGGEQAIADSLEERYLEVKARKQVCLTREDAGSFFHYLPPGEREATVEAATRGLTEVLAVENLDGNVVEATCEFMREYAEVNGAGRMYCSQGEWHAARDLEFFFPHLDSLPVERTLALLKADAIVRGRLDGQTIEEAAEAEAAAAGLFIVGVQRMALTPDQAQVLCKDLVDSSDHGGAMSVLLTEPGVVAMCLEGRGAIGKWNLLCGPANSGIAREHAPTTLRARWGTDSTSNAVHASANMAASEEELPLLFPAGSLRLQRTLCIVKPDAMPQLLELRQLIEQAGFTVLKEKHMVLTEERAQEFYRDYKDKPSFQAQVKHATSGPCCALLLCRLEAVSVWLQLMGPEVVKEARRVRPKSVRAVFGTDGQRNAVHGSESVKNAAREVQLFFPELGADPAPDDDEVRDFLFRKSAGASMDLKSMSDADAMSLTDVDPTLQQLLSRGLMALCQVQPKGLAAVRWLSRWLTENNPNKEQEDCSTTGGQFAFNPQDRTKKYIEHGVNIDGVPFAVEAPPAENKKQVIDVDVSEETEEQRIADLSTPPFVIFMVGGPGSGKGTLCATLRDEFNLVHLSMADLMREEVAADTYLGSEIYKHMQQGTQVPDTATLKLLKKTMVKHQDTNRFVLDGFPRSIEQAKRFEQEVAEIAFTMFLKATPDVMKQRVANRAAKGQSARDVDDSPDTVEKRIAAFDNDTIPLVNFYNPIGKLRIVDADKEVDDVYNEVRRFLSCRFLYLMGPPGAPIPAIADRLEVKYGYTSINVTEILKDFVKSGEKDAAKVKQALAKGKPVDASIICPLLLSEVYREMALGVQNFVICDFPQSPKQVEFLEYRIPSVSKTILLDFSRADAQDLASLSPSSGGDEDGLEAEVKIAALFGEETQEMLRSRQGLVRVPSSLAAVENLGAGGAAEGALEQKLTEAAWAGISDTVMPGLTVVLGLPCSGTEVLAPLLAALTPNTYAVDCDQLLDKELERKTEIGLTMHNMLARGQIVPLSMTLELLKNVVNLTCSDSLVIENCPMYVDQIEYITKEFRIERVFHICGSDKAVAGWREQYLSQSKSEDSSPEAKAFDERLERLDPIVTHFSRLGKLEQLYVNETPKETKLEKMIEQATMPRLALVGGLSPAKCAEQAALLAKSCGVGPALTTDGVTEWARNALQRSVDPADPKQFFAALKQYADSTSFPLIVLDRYPSSAADAAALLEYFGEPKVAVNLQVDEEFQTDEWKAANEEADIEEEEILKMLQGERSADEATFKVFEEKCPTSCLKVDYASVKSSEELAKVVRKRLFPRVYVITAPSGRADFSGLVASAVCTARREGKRPMKFTVINSEDLFKSGGHGSAIEDKLSKAAFTASTPDELPAPLWVELFGEALAQSANPMGTFLVTNFPTPCSARSSPTIRDQFDMLESITTLVGILHVKLTEAAFARYCSDSPAEWTAYEDFDAMVYDTNLKQFSSSLICDCVIDDMGKPEEAAKKAAAQLLDFQDKAEKGGI